MKGSSASSSRRSAAARVSEEAVARRKRSEQEEGGCDGSYMRGEMTAHGESDRTASIQRLLRFNGQDGTAADGSHVATVKRWWS